MPGIKAETKLGLTPERWGPIRLHKLVQSSAFRPVAKNIPAIDVIETVLGSRVR
jgi:hypothetical protein